MTILSSRNSINILNSMPRLDTSFLLAAVLTLVFLTKYITVPHKKVVKGGKHFLIYLMIKLMIKFAL